MEFAGAKLSVRLRVSPRPPAATEPPPGRRPRLVAVNRSYWPDHSATGQLLTDLAERMAAAGWEVEVLASRARYDDPAVLLPRLERRAGVTIRRLPAVRLGRGRLAGRLADGLLFHAAAAAALLRLLRPGDVMLAKSDPPLVGATAALAARVRGAALVNWCQDLFPDMAAVLGVRPARGPAGRLLRAVGGASLRAAAANVVPDAGMAAPLRPRGVAPARVAVIPNWPDARVRPVPRDANPLRRAWGLGEERFVVGYAGNLGRIHDVGGVVRLALELGREPGLALLFVGGGHGFAPLRLAVAAQGLPEGAVTFRPYQPRELLAESLSAPDLHLVTLRPDCEGLAFPSKLAGAMAAGRPTLFVGDPEGAVARLLRATGAGVTLAPDAPAAAWREEVLRLRRDRERYLEMARKARAAYERCFAAPDSLALWADLLGRVAAPEAAAPPAPAPAPAGLPRAAACGTLRR